MKVEHLEEVGLTYLEHCKRALLFALWSFRMGIACTIHAVFPCLFTDTFSENVLRLSKFLREENEEHKNRQ